MNIKKVWRYTRLHWKSLYIQAYGIFIFAVFCVGGVAIMMKTIPNFIPPEMLTMFVLFLLALQILNFFFAAAEDIKKKEDKKSE